jgi:hypothetical protein
MSLPLGSSLLPISEARALSLDASTTLGYDSFGLPRFELLVMNKSPLFKEMVTKGGNVPD